MTDVRKPFAKGDEKHLMEYVDFGEWEVDKEGRIWRTHIRVKGGEAKPVLRERVEKPVPSGHLLVAGCIDGRRLRCMAHRLVWQNFHGDIPDGLVINHLNGIKTDNRPTNLEVCTHAENLDHARRTGLNPRRARYVLGSEGISKIQTEYQTGNWSIRCLAEKFGVSRTVVTKILRDGGVPIRDA